MLLGARQFFEKRGGGGWQNPYVTDGLVAMWDGEWNAGGGKHESAPMLWQDLSGNGLNMISNGEPNFGDNYMTSTKVANLWHTDETSLADDIFTEGKFTFSIAVHMANISGGQKLLMLGGGALTNGICCVTNQTTDGRYGGDIYVQGSGNVGAYSAIGRLGTIDAFCDGVTYGAYYTNFSGGTNGRTANISALPIGYVSKRFTIGYRYTYTPDSPNIGGMQIFNIRVYSRALTAAEIAANYAIDKARFSLP